MPRIKNRAKPVPNGACMEPESEATAPHTKRAKPDQIGAVPVDTHNQALNSNSYFIDQWGVQQMPNIKSSADLRNSYNDISNFCHQYSEPVFITKNGKGDLAVMSIEAYEQLLGRFELYGLIREGIDDIRSGNTRPFSDALADIRARRKK